jgi:hypothetical protein
MPFKLAWSVSTHFLDVLPQLVPTESMRNSGATRMSRKASYTMNYD